MPTILPLLLFSNLFIIAYAGKGCSDAQADAVRNIRFRIQYTPATTDSIPVSGWGGGGGPRGKIQDGQGINAINNTFAGREFGGGDRNTIYGTREYGSGYPYGAEGANPSSSIAGRPFPYGIWPISWGPTYLGGGEFYGEDLDMIRPGGPLVTVKIGTKDTTKWPGVSPDELYEMIGDKESIAFMMADLVDWCHVTPQWPRRFDTTKTQMPQPDNVIQYYRASSFALTFSGYNNTVGATTGSNYSLSHSPALPSSIATSPFLRCLNETIAIALPIMDAYSPPGGNGGLAPGVIVGIVFGSLAGAVIVFFFGWNVINLVRSIMEKRRQRRSTSKNVDRAVEEILAQREAEAGKDDVAATEEGRKKEDEVNTVYQ